MEPAPTQGLDATAEVAPSDVMVKAVYAWVNQFGRTLKTCRLYDAGNPTVVKFRNELSAALIRLLEQFGGFTLTFTADDVMFGEESLYAARSRDDNLALPFHRDGIRSLTFSPGISEHEVGGLVDAVLQVTGQNSGQDDLVTLVWEGHFSHLDIDYVPAEGDFGSATAPEAAETDSPAPWPKPDETAAAAETTTAEAEPEAAHGGEGRSDDWATGALTAEIEAGFAELEALAGSQVPRFLTDYNSERGVADVTTALAIARACLTTGVNQEDRNEFARYVPRLLRLSITAGAWLEAREALALLDGIGSDDWSSTTLSQELLQPISVSGVREKIDQQEPAQVADFVAFARALGDPGVDLLNLVLAESEQRRNRHALAEAIAEVCRTNPERLAPFLSDRRWYVVRNVVHILGWIGGGSILPMLQVAMRHPDARVRQEIVAALGQIEPRQSRPLLVKMLDGADTRMFCAVLHQLSAERHAPTARLLLGYLLDADFENRPAEEKRAIYSTLGAVGGDEIVPELEAELLRGNWFARGQDNHRQSVARVLARIGTAKARMALDRGATSRRQQIRQACELAIMGMNEHE